MSRLSGISILFNEDQKINNIITEISKLRIVGYEFEIFPNQGDYRPDLNNDWKLVLKHENLTCYCFISFYINDSNKERSNFISIYDWGYDAEEIFSNIINNNFLLKQLRSEYPCIQLILDSKEKVDDFFLDDETVMAFLETKDLEILKPFIIL